MVAFDEIGQVMDPRSWEQESSSLRRFFQLHRHHHLDIFGTTQDISLVAKSALIVVDQWILCQKLEDGAIAEWIFKKLGWSRIRVRYQDMTFQELKKLSRGISGLEDPEKADELQYKGDIENLEWDDFEFEVKYRDVNFKLKKLLHEELNEFKEELYHYYCPQCQGRQLDPIPKSLPFLDIPPRTCPKHFCPLDIRKTGIFDTDYDIEIPDKEVEWRPFVKSPPGHLKIPYKGPLSQRLVSEYSRLQKKL